MGATTAVICLKRCIWLWITPLVGRSLWSCLSWPGILFVIQLAVPFMLIRLDSYMLGSQPGLGSFHAKPGLGRTRSSRRRADCQGLVRKVVSWHGFAWRSSCLFTCDCWNPQRQMPESAMPEPAVGPSRPLLGTSLVSNSGKLSVSRSSMYLLISCIPRNQMILLRSRGCKAWGSMYEGP